TPLFRHRYDGCERVAIGPIGPSEPVSAKPDESQLPAVHRLSAEKWIHDRESRRVDWWKWPDFHRCSGDVEGGSDDSMRPDLPANVWLPKHACYSGRLQLRRS